MQKHKKPQDNEKISKNILDIVFLEQKRLNMTTKELAEAIGCTARVINYWKNGQREISLYWADRALKALGVSYKIGLDQEERTEI